MASEIKVQVDSPELGYLNVRSQPQGALVTTVAHDSILVALEPEATARAKIGQYGQWLHVRLADNRDAYVAAWYLKLPPVADTTVDSTAQSTIEVWVYSPEVGYLNIRKSPSTRGALITQAQHNASVTSLESKADTQAKLGQRGQWLHLRLDDGREGYAAASYLSSVSPSPPDTSLEPPEDDKIAITSDLSTTERQVAQAWNRLGGRLQTLAEQLAIDPGVAVAVWRVESAGASFGSDGRMTIRFENHVFYDYWGKNHPDTFSRHFTFNSGQRWTGHQWRPLSGEAWRACHKGQDGEWQAFNFACTLDDTAARSSISMGGPQIMGFNYKSLGYTSVQEMFQAFTGSEGNQVLGFFNFCRSRTKTIPMLQNSDFVGFAGVYNGSGQAQTYGSLIQKAYDAYRRLRTVSFGVSFAAPTGEALAPMVEENDLRRILGIGSKTAARLEAEGIQTFAQLAALNVEHLQNLLGSTVGRLRWLETWPAQACLAAWGDWTALKKLQAEIKSRVVGRH